MAVSLLSLSTINVYNIFNRELIGIIDAEDNDRGIIFKKQFLRSYAETNPKDWMDKIISSQIKIKPLMHVQELKSIFPC